MPKHIRHPSLSCVDDSLHQHRKTVTDCSDCSGCSGCSDSGYSDSAYSGCSGSACSGSAYSGCSDCSAYSAPFLRRHANKARTVEGRRNMTVARTARQKADCVCPLPCGDPDGITSSVCATIRRFMQSIYSSIYFVWIAPRMPDSAFQKKPTNTIATTRWIKPINPKVGAKVT